MIKVEALINILKKQNGIFTGVPDSVLKELSFFCKIKNHIVAANEGLLPQ